MVIDIPPNHFYECPHCHFRILSWLTVRLCHCPICGVAYPPIHRCPECHGLINPKNFLCPFDGIPVRTFFSCPYNDCNKILSPMDFACPACKRPFRKCSYCGAPNHFSDRRCFDCGVTLSD